MDGHHFDRLTRTLSSRRTALGGLLGGTLTLIGLGMPSEVAGHNPIPACKKIKNSRKRAACLRRARAHNRKHKQCVSEPKTTTCAGRCGIRTDNCRKSVTCDSCPTGKSCLVNGGCARICTDPGPGCPGACFGCGLHNTEGVQTCVPPVAVCPTQSCSSTAQCPPSHHCQPCTEGGPTVCFPLCTA